GFCRRLECGDRSGRVLLLRLQVCEQKVARRFPRRSQHGDELYAPIAEERRQTGYGIDAWIQVALRDRVRTEWRTQRITDDDGLPAERRHRGIERFREIEPARVRGKQNASA